MKKGVLLLVGALLIAYQSSAQVSVGVGGGILKPTEENSEAHIGFELYGKYDVMDAFRVGINLGFYQKAYDFFGGKLKTNYMPVSVSGEYLFLDGKFRPYVGLHVGMLRVGASFEGENNSESYFSLAPVAGVEYSITDNLGINFNFKYGFAFIKNEISDEVESYPSISPNLGVFYKF